MAAEAWNNYLTRSTQRSATSVNKANLKRTLEKREKRVFLRNDNINVRITDIDQSGGTAISNVYINAETLSSALGGSLATDTGVRLISVYSENSIKPLMITSELMCKILQRYDVHPDFLQVLLSFGEEPHVAEASSSNSAVHSSEEISSSSISYRVNYVEENLRQAINPWSFRHTGVYHCHISTFDLFIILHPNKGSVLEARILEWLGIDASKRFATSTNPENLSLRQDPFHLHLLVLSSFFDNWRWYLRHLGEKFNEESDQAMTTHPEEADPKESFNRVKALRNVNDWAYQAQACCKSNLEVIRKLKNSSIIAFQDPRELDSLETTLNGSIESSEALIPRIRNTIDLVGYTLTLHNQMETALVDKELRDLTGQLKRLQQDTVDDSATVKIITFVSAVYLPGSFVVSLYGMNFFAFDQSSMRIIIAKDFWIFVATWLPLTVVTCLIYILILLFDAWWKGKSFQLFKRRKRLQMEGEAVDNEIYVVNAKAG